MPLGESNAIDKEYWNSTEGFAPQGILGDLTMSGGFLVATTLGRELCCWHFVSRGQGCH